MSKLAGLKLASNVAKVLELVDPTSGLPLKAEDGSMVTITLLSNDSDVAVAFDRKTLDARSARKIRPTSKDFEEEMLMRSAKLTQAWNMAALDGVLIEDFPCNESNAIELYRECPWILEQVLGFTQSRANYKKA